MVEMFTEHMTGKPEKGYVSTPLSEPHNKNTFIADMTNKTWE